jgi:hypothetical protein
MLTQQTDEFDINYEVNKLTQWYITEKLSEEVHPFQSAYVENLTELITAQVDSQLSLQRTNCILHTLY